MINKNDAPKKIEELRLSEIITTKFGLQMVADSLSIQIKNGIVDPLEMAVRMKALEELAKIVRSNIEDQVINKVSAMPNEKTEILGAKVSVVNTRTYDYSSVDGWAELNKEIASLSEKRKHIEEEEKKWRRGELPLKSNSLAYKIELSK